MSEAEYIQLTFLLNKLNDEVSGIFKDVGLRIIVSPNILMDGACVGVYDKKGFLKAQATTVNIQECVNNLKTKTNENTN